MEVDTGRLHAQERDQARDPAQEDAGAPRAAAGLLVRSSAHHDSTSVSAKSVYRLCEFAF